MNDVTTEERDPTTVAPAKPDGDSKAEAILAPAFYSLCKLQHDIHNPGKEYTDPDWAMYSASREYHEGPDHFADALAELDLDTEEVVNDLMARGLIWNWVDYYSQQGDAARTCH